MRRAFLIGALLALGCPAASAAEWWRPFHDDLADAVRERGPWTVARDGEFGADLLWLHEPGATGGPTLTMDGLPVGTGHRWADDVWTVPLAGARLVEGTTGGVGLVDAGGVIALRSASPDSMGAVADAHFFKGGDESYLRRLAFRTQEAPWIVRFDFDEQILYDYTLSEGQLADGYVAPGHHSVPGDVRTWAGDEDEAKNNIARIGLQRRMEDGTALEAAFTRFRKHKTTLPVQDLDRHDLRGEELRLRWESPVRAGRISVGVVSTATDLVLEPREAGIEERRIEATRHTLVLGAKGLARGWDLSASAADWRVADGGAGDTWAGDYADPSRIEGREGEARLSRGVALAGARGRVDLGAGWADGAGARPTAAVSLQSGAWNLDLAHGGRAPRSDERGSAWTLAAPDRIYRVLPNPDLGWERSQRAGLRWSGRRAGWTVDAGAVYRRLRDGVGWCEDVVAATETERSGRWENGLEIDGWAADVGASRRGRFAGLWQLDARLAVRGWNADGGERNLQALNLPPERSAALTARWQHAYFHGDGIVELAWTVDHRGAMADPWLPGPDHALSAATLHHALVMFRLTGADLGFEFRNVLDRNVPWSSGSLSRGREMRMRLEWVLRR